MVIETGALLTLDTNCLIYYFENHPTYADLLEGLYNGIQKGEYRAVLSVLSIMEIFVKPKKDRNLFLEKRYKLLLFNFPNMEVYDINPNVADLGAALRAKYGVKTPDALILATALLSNSKYFVSNDTALASVCVNENITPLLLKDLK